MIMPRCCQRLLALAIALGTLSAIADTVTFADGSTVHGKVERAADGKLTVATDFAGTITADMAKVKSITTDEQYKVELASGSTLVGSLTREGDNLLVNTANGTLNVTNDKIVNLYGKDEESPEVLKARQAIRKWRYEANFDLSGRSGNTERQAFAGGAKAILSGPNDRLLFYLRAQYAETEGEKSTDEIIGGVDYEQRISGSRHSWYTRTELESDDIEQLDLRATAALGYGYYFLDSDDHKLRGRIGALYRHESWEVREDESTGGLDLGLYHMLRFSQARLVTDITYTPSLEEPSRDYRIHHETSLEFPLTSERMKMALGVANDYSSQPPPDIERLDTYYFARLILSWQ